MPILSNFSKGSPIPANKTIVRIQLNYPSGYNGVSTVSLTVLGSTTTISTNSSGYVLAEVNCGTITVAITALPSGLALPSSQTVTSAGGDEISVNFTIAAGGSVTYYGSTNWTVPNGISAITATLIGGGAGGSAPHVDSNTIFGQSYPDYYGGNGGSSSYTTTVTLSVISGEILTIVVGSGGSGSYGTFNNSGGSSYISRSGTILAQAYGGSGGYGRGSRVYTEVSKMTYEYVYTPPYYRGGYPYGFGSGPGANATEYGGGGWGASGSSGYSGGSGRSGYVTIRW